MAAKRKVAKAGAAKGAATTRPYVQRLLEDEELRGNIAHAFESARSAVGRINNGKSPTKAVIYDRKFQRDIRNAAESFRDASLALREAPKRPKPKAKRRGGPPIGKLLLLAVVGGAIALAVNENLRNKLLDALFGAEEEFEYTSTTSPSGQPAGSAS